MSDFKRSPVRPRIHQAGDPRRNVTFQAGSDLYDRLGQAAAEAGHSLSREVENRLIASFQSADIRQIVREEIAASITRPQHSLGDRLSLMENIRSSVR